jgi:iron complex transport system ATP-binding protein
MNKGAVSINEICIRKGQNQIINNVSATFYQGEIHAIVGPNGSGKSTLLKALCGIIPILSGSILYDGIELSMLNDRDISRRRALLNQQNPIAFNFTVRELIMMGRYPHFSQHHSEDDLQICREVVDFMHLGNLINRSFFELSGGEKQRVHMARVFAQIWNNAKDKSIVYLFLDEPLLSLDLYHQIELFTKLKSIAIERNIVVVAVLHELTIVSKFADRVSLLMQGELFTSGLTNNVLTADNLKKIFNVSTSIISFDDKQYIIY